MKNLEIVLTVDCATISAGGTHLINTVSFAMRAGDIIALLGQNGCGKTSLLRQLCGFRKTSQGSILIGDTPLSTLSDAERVQAICYVPQRLESIPNVSVYEFLQASSHRFRSLPSGRIEIALTRCGLEHLATRSLQVLSGGELRRVLLATAFLNDAPIILLDEPTSSLDPTHHATIVALISELATTGRAILFATHDLILDLRTANRAFAIYNTLLSEVDLTTGFLSAADLEEIYGIPFQSSYECMIPVYEKRGNEQ